MANMPSRSTKAFVDWGGYGGAVLFYFVALVFVTLAWNVVDPDAATTRIYQIDQNGTTVEMAEVIMPETTATLPFRNGQYVYCATTVTAAGAESDYSDVVRFTVRGSRVRQTYP